MNDDSLFQILGPSLIICMIVVALVSGRLSARNLEKRSGAVRLSPERGFGQIFLYAGLSLSLAAAVAATITLANAKPESARVQSTSR